MLKVTNLSKKYGTRTLFSNVSIEFKDDNCYGIIGANGAGKSTFLKIISGEVDSSTGDVILGKDERISTLRQNHNEFNDFTVIDTVISGDTELYRIGKAKDALYEKVPFTEEDGLRVGDLEEKFAARGGWEAESNAGVLLSALGINNDLFNEKMEDLKDSIKVKVLLARALFGDPDVLLLDEPTNGLDAKSIMWLEEFLINFKHTVLVVSHDRHFLNQVCTNMVDIDYEKATLYVGNYDFWYQSSELIQQQMKDSNKKKEDKIKELEDFIRRFSANASKSKQATSRKRALEKIKLDEIVPSSRKYPYINFEIDKTLGKDVITLENINYSIDGKVILKNMNLNIRPDNKIALIGNNEIAKTALLGILAGDITPDSGTVNYGNSVTVSYFKKNHDEYFKEKISILNWLLNRANSKDESYVRGFLGRMLFSGEEALKNVDVLSGGEKVRSMLSLMMLKKGNVLIMDEPTNHLDIESITSLNEGLKNFKGALVIATYDQEIIDSACNRLIEIKKDGHYNDKEITYEEYIDKFGIEEM